MLKLASELTIQHAREATSSRVPFLSFADDTRPELAPLRLTPPRMFGGVKQGKMAGAMKDDLGKFLRETRTSLQAAAKK